MIISIGKTLNFSRSRRWSRCLMIWRMRWDKLLQTSSRCSTACPASSSRMSCSMPRNKTPRSEQMLTLWKTIELCPTWKTLRNSWWTKISLWPARRRPKPNFQGLSRSRKLSYRMRQLRKKIGYYSSKLLSCNLDSQEAWKARHRQHQRLPHSRKGQVCQHKQQHLQAMQQRPRRRQGPRPASLS